MKDDRLDCREKAKTRLKTNRLRSLVSECCSMPTAVLNASRLGRPTTDSGRAFCWHLSFRESALQASKLASESSHSKLL